MENYPDWALANPNDPSFPWNQHDPDPVEVEVTAYLTIRKTTSVLDDRCLVEEFVEEEYDDEGHIYRTGGRNIDYSNCDFNEDFTEQHISPLILLKEYQGILIDELKKIESTASRSKIAELKHKIECCDGWDYESLEVERE